MFSPTTSIHQNAQGLSAPQRGDARGIAGGSRASAAPSVRMHTYVFQMEGAQGDAPLSFIERWTATRATIRALKAG